MTQIMTKCGSAQAVEQALSFQTPDRLAVFEGFWSEFVENWRKKNRLSPETNIEDHFGVDLKVLVANETFFPTQMRNEGSSGEFVLMNDGWGRVIRTKPGTYFMEPVARLLGEPGDLDKIHFDPPDLDNRYDDLAPAAAACRKKDQAVFVKIGGLFIRGSFFRGETEFLMDLVGDQSFARALVEKMEVHFTQIALESLKRADAWNCGLWIYDDMCNVNAPMFSPDVFEKIFLPSYQRMIRTFKAAGARRVILHCDGNLNPFLDLVVEAGFDGINPVESAAGLDVVKLLEKYYGRLSFIGGVCNTHVLPSGDANKIRRHVEAIVDAGRRGGLVIGTHSVGPDISVESYELYRQIVAEKGAYKK